MEEIKGNIISRIPFKGLLKVEDLLTFEGNTILSHFKDDEGYNFLFYWVDFSNELNRWLVWKVSKDSLYQYLKGGASLKDLVLNKIDKDFLFIIDINKKLEHETVSLTTVSDIPIDYIPEDNSYFQYAFPSIYNHYFIEFDYVNVLREGALYFTLKSVNDKFGSTIGVKDAADFLNGIYKSFSEYSEYNFFHLFKATTADSKRLRKSFENLQEPKSFRICDMAYSSFNVGLATDTVNTPSDIDGKYLDWKKGVVTNYKNDVVDYDFNSEIDASLIVEKFPDPELRKRIFEPILKVIENPNLSLKVSNFDKTFKKDYARIKSINKNKILPAPTIDELIAEKFPKRKLIQVYVEIPEDENIANISKRELKSGLLFSQETNEFPFKINKIQFEGQTIELTTPLFLIGTFKDGIYQLTFDTLNIKVQSENKDDLSFLFNKAFYEIYSNLVNRQSENPGQALSSPLQLEQLINAINNTQDE